MPSLSAGETDAVYKRVHGLLDDKRVSKVSYGTEASFFEAYGVPAVVCGPGSIEQAHKAIEFFHKEGRTLVPVAGLAVLLLGPGTSITHEAVKTLTDMSR